MIWYIKIYYKNIEYKIWNIILKYNIIFGDIMFDNII